MMPMRKVIITATSFGKTSREPLEILNRASIEVVINKTGKPYTESELIELVKDVDGMIVGVDPITSRVINSAPRLKVIAKHGVGIDNIDINEAIKRKIYVTITHSANTQAVADLTFALILGTARKIAEADLQLREGNWPRLIGVEVWEKTIGIIGIGQIGKAVAKRAKGFDMHILAYDIKPDLEFCLKEGIELCTLERLLSESDIISLHLPLTDETRFILNRENLAKVKDGVIIVNTARGELIDIDAIYDALVRGKVRAVGLDVFSKEPPELSHPIFKLKNVVLTPHIGSYTEEANTNMGIMSAKSIVDVFEGRTPKYWVNPF
jgi:D-3-phosphoglycerate dehydrogenase